MRSVIHGLVLLRTGVRLTTMPLKRSDPLSSWLRFRIDVGAPTNIKDRISHLAESKCAALEHAYAAAGAATIKDPAAHELLSCEIPERQSLEGRQYRTHVRL
jgi:hypothetical protein